MQKYNLIVHKVLLVAFLAAYSSIWAFSQTEIPANAIITSDVYVIDPNGNVVKTNKPVFKFEHSSFDFQEVKQSGKISHDFVFTNIGKQPLVISEVKNACYCITSHWDSKTVMPGETGTITVFYNTEAKTGKFRTGVSIISNAYSYPVERLFVEGKVVVEPQTEPENPPALITTTPDPILPADSTAAEKTEAEKNLQTSPYYMHIPLPKDEISPK